MAGPRRTRPEADRKGLRRPGTGTVLAGSLASGLGAYVFQVIGTRTLGDEAFAPIGVLWTIHYLALTVGLISVEAHVARTLTIHEDDPEAVRRSLRAMTLWVAVVAALIGTVTFAFRGPLFDGAAELSLVVTATVSGYGVFVLVRGWLAGSYRFREYGAATALESLGRLAAGAGVAAFAASTRALAWTLAAGPWAVAAWWAAIHRRPARSTGRPAAPIEGSRVESGSAARYLAATTAANAASQTLLAAGPLVLLPLGARPAEVSVFFVTITAARVPLVFAFNGVLSRILPPLARAARRGEHRRIRRLAIWIVVAALTLAGVGAAAGAWIGPAVVAAFFGADFRPQGWFVALTVAGVVWATAGLGLNQMLIAMGIETRLVLPWLIALIVGAATISLADGIPSYRVILGFVTGEAAALAGLLATVLSYRPTAGSPAPSPEPFPSPLQIAE